MRCDRGEIHAIVGENGAGKSTLMKVLYGLERADSGIVSLNSQRLTIRSPQDALAAGIGMVHQELIQISEFSVWENVVLGIEPVGPLGGLKTREARLWVQERIDEFGFSLRAEMRLGDLSVAARQKVEILKLLCRDAQILILDEPTAVLTPQEIPAFFNELRRLRDTGRTLLFISHHLDEVLTLSDHITVLRRGRWVTTRPAAELHRLELARLMVGQDWNPPPPGPRQTPGAPILTVDALRVTSADGRPGLVDVNLRVHAGEVVGVAGVEGNGQSELVGTLVGLVPPDQVSGLVQIGSTQVPRTASVLERRRRLGLVPSDRARAGGALDASILENVLMGHHRLNPGLTLLAGTFVNFRSARRMTESIRDRFSVIMSNAKAPLRSLSGGNQQKVILGRELAGERPLLVLDQPTRGLDVRATEAVHTEIRTQRDLGRAILLVSSDLEELFALSDRLVVLHRGRLAATLTIESTTLDQVGRIMLTGSDDAA